MADYQTKIREFEEKKIRIIAASTDNQEDAQKMVERRKLTFPVAFGVDAKEFVGMTGAFFDDKKLFLHATAFIIRPDGTLEDIVYSTGPIGRLTAADVLMLIDYRMKAASQSR